MHNEDMAKTQEMEIPETIADFYENDPLGLFTHRQEMDCRDIDSTSFQEANAAHKPCGDFTK